MWVAFALGGIVVEDDVHWMLHGLNVWLDGIRSKMPCRSGLISLLVLSQRWNAAHGTRG